jgi:hypothetical protein
MNLRPLVGETGGRGDGWGGLTNDPPYARDNAGVEHQSTEQDHAAMGSTAHAAPFSRLGILSE